MGVGLTLEELAVLFNDLKIIVAGVEIVLDELAVRFKDLEFVLVVHLLINTKHLLIVAVFF